MSVMDAPPADQGSNASIIEAWNGVLFDRFVRFRDMSAPDSARTASRGCAFIHPDPATGRSTSAAGSATPPGGSPGSWEPRARRSASTPHRASSTPLVGRRRQVGGGNARFVVADVQAGALEGGFDYAFSRFGTMFFANPVVGLRNVRRALVPGGRLCMVVWRRKLDNQWLHRAERVVERFLTRPEVTDEPTCGPGPFSMADADTTTDVLVRAGFENISLHRCDGEIAIGSSLQQAVEFVMALGPAGELIRLAGSDAERRRPAIVAALHESLAELQRPTRHRFEHKPRRGSSELAHLEPSHEQDATQVTDDGGGRRDDGHRHARGGGRRKPGTRPVVRELTSFAAPGCEGGCGSGSTIGPDNALYVTDGRAAASCAWIPRTGATRPYASGLPPAIPDVGIGGAIDVAFVGRSA